MNAAPKPPLSASDCAALLQYAQVMRHRLAFVETQTQMLKDLAESVENLLGARELPVPSAPLRTREQARQWMDEQGLSQADLADRFGVTSSLIDAILRGAKPCKRGASHNIAVFLGIKRGQAVAAKQAYTRAGATQEARA